MKRAAPPPSRNNYHNTIINMNHNNDDINEACSSLLDSPPYRNKEPLPVYRQYGQTSNSQQQQQQQQQQKQNKQAPTLPVMCTLISPPTPDKPAAFACSPASTLKHANTTAAAAATTRTTPYYAEPQKPKSVSFAPTATVQPINIPKASEMTTQEKQLIWYLGYDYNQFKNNAASDGGVKLVRSMKDSCHFFCIGSFDGSCDEDTSSSSNSGSNHSSDAATAGSSRTSPSGKFYNEHEYNDYVKEDGQEVCKRGLGYHFSRIRKRNRVMTRSAVVAWQKCMQKPSNKQRIEKVVQRKMEATSSRKNRPQLQQTQSVVLASVSTKCSRVSREEALWRGNIDFRVAYPERCRFGIVDSIQRKRSSGSASDDVAYHAGKRRRSNECAYSREADGNNSMKVSAARYAQV
mmetsp:Transcript_22179/g.28410  ORF Transcript_22179/g.28410 Transcript_22179/m.28410 type:complete len:405 (-) Transcript_22179:73-1287(-)